VDVCAQEGVGARPSAFQDSSIRDLQLLTIDEVAAYLRCSTKSIRRRVSEGRLLAIRTVSHRLLFRRCDIAAFLDPNDPGQARSPITHPAGPAGKDLDSLDNLARDLAG
jgi:excisionase family DNA binding protein